MNNVLRSYMQCLNELTLKYEHLIQRYKLVDNLDFEERKKMFEVIMTFENFKLWAKNVLYGDHQEPYEDKDSNSEISNIKEMLSAQLKVSNQINQHEIEEQIEDKEQVSIISRRELPRICRLTREFFKDPVSHRYEISEKVPNICKNHVFEKEALVKYLGNQKKKICPIVGCNFFIVKKFLKRDQEILDCMKENFVKLENQVNIQSLID